VDYVKCDTKKDIYFMLCCRPTLQVAVV